MDHVLVLVQQPSGTFDASNAVYAHRLYPSIPPYVWYCASSVVLVRGGKRR